MAIIEYLIESFKLDQFLRSSGSTTTVRCSMVCSFLLNERRQNVRDESTTLQTRSTVRPSKTRISTASAGSPVANMVVETVFSTPKPTRDRTTVNPSPADFSTVPQPKNHVFPQKTVFKRPKTVSQPSRTVFQRPKTRFHRPHLHDNPKEQAPPPIFNSNLNDMYLSRMMYSTRLSEHDRDATLNQRKVRDIAAALLKA